MKQKIIKELKTHNFPNLKFLYSKEALDVSFELLNELLEEDKKNFEKKLKIKDSNINFELFDEESDLNYFWSLLNHLLNVNSGDKIRKIIEDFEPILTKYYNEISFSKKYFEILEYCLKNCNLNNEQTKIISDSVKGFKIRGINLEKEKQEELKKISLELSKLTTKFSNNVLDSEKEFEYFLETDEHLKEFPESDLQNARNLYKKKTNIKKSLKFDAKGNEIFGYAFDSSISSYISIMKYCSNSNIRKHFSDVNSNFASNGKFDNREIVLKIINLRNEKSKILGYNNYSELSLEFKMADSSEQVLKLLEDLSNKAKPKALAEIKEIKDHFNLENLESWDILYYSRILKKEKYNLDDKKLKEYFEFKNTQTALFTTVEKLYNITMKPCSDIKLTHSYSSDIEIYEVYKNGEFISYFLGDYFYNENKRSGAWADEIRDRFGDKKSIVINNMSFVKNKNSPVLLTLGEVTTMFHEFGHGIHSMLSKSKYGDLTGFGVEWDFVELPSQIMEKWASDSETIINVAKHYKTGDKITKELLESLNKLKYFGNGMQVLGQNIYSITDMMFYSGIKFKNVEDLDQKYLEKINKLSIFKKGENYKKYTSFDHIFSGGYSAGYYSYMWADIIVDDIWVKFKEKGVYNKEFALEFENKILGAGSIKKAGDMFIELMGRGIKINAFLKEKGLE